jgi:nucleoside phosphorylase
VKAQADLLLVTVTQEESLAVLAAFNGHTGKKARPEARGDKVYHDLGIINGTRAWLVLSGMGAGGLGGAQQTVAKAIAELRPAAVVMVGIAFGMDETKQAIGDILVSASLRLYELQRVGSAKGKLKIVLRGSRPDASSRLLDASKNADLHWQGAKVHFGCVLTGEKLVDNRDFREELRRYEIEAIGGEMEGGGLYTACQDAKVDWLLVKAICDWADGHKSENKAKRQALAARNAAEFVLQLLKTVSFKPNGDGPGEQKQDDLQRAVYQTGTGGLSVGHKNVVAGQGGVAIGGDLIISTGSQTVAKSHPAGKGKPVNIGLESLEAKSSLRQRDQIFISYSHRDDRWLDLLRIHLAPYVRAGGCDVWCDKDIEPGAAWRTSIQMAIQRAKVAVLLVSPYFLASDFIAKQELPPLLAASRQEGTTILWIPVSASAYDVTEIKDYQAAAPPARPLDQLSTASRNGVLVKICKLIQQAVAPGN